MFRYYRIMRIFAVFFLIVCAVCTQQAQAGNQAAVNFLVLSDIHFNPFVSCVRKVKPCPVIAALRDAPAKEWPAILARFDQALPTYRIDTNYSLLNSTLLSSQQAAKDQQVQFVLILGDFLGHDFKRYYKKFTTDNTFIDYQSFTRKTLEFLAIQLHRAFPGKNIYPVIGNNDTYQDDYESQIGGPFFAETSDLFPTMQTTFSGAGYYALTLPTAVKLRLVVLNTNLFSYKGIGQGINQAADDELAWLHSQLLLARSNHQKVLIAMHIPQAIDVYITKRTRLFQLMQLWKPNYSARFDTELAQFAPEISGVLFGHLHAEATHILTVNANQEIPLLGISSISPFFSNNPSFKVISYEPATQRLKQVTTYSYSLMNSATVATTKYTILNPPADIY